MYQDRFKYDFTSIMDRKGKDAYAFDGLGGAIWGYEPTAPMEGFDFIPMWVADMNFPTCPSVTRALMERAEHPAFGYFFPPDDYFEAIIRWRQGGHIISPRGENRDFGTDRDDNLLFDRGISREKENRDLCNDSAQASAPANRDAQSQNCDSGRIGEYEGKKIVSISPHKDLKREHIGYENGVHGFITSAVQVLTKPGDCILLHSPNYVGFRSDTWRQGRKCVFSSLVLDEHGIWRMDYSDMEAKIERYSINVMIFCSPQNPSGRVWEEWELKEMMEVLERHNVKVISDEIWSDLTFSGYFHTPLQDVSDYARENTVACYAPSKTFNLAGLIGSYHIIYNDKLRASITDWGWKTNYNEMNVLSMHALIGGYSSQGREWLLELNRVLEGNAAFACDFIEHRFPLVQTSMPQGTYMLWMDLTKYLNKSRRTLDDVIKAGWQVGVGWEDGRKFEGPSHIRLNLASPLSRITEAFQRMDKYVFN